jgi:hypothetical protein
LVLTRARHLSLLWAVSVQSILILSSHIYLGLPSGLFHSGFSHRNPVCTHLSSFPHVPPALPFSFIRDFFTRIIFGDLQVVSSNFVRKLFDKMPQNVLGSAVQLKWPLDLKAVWGSVLQFSWYCYWWRLSWGGFTHSMPCPCRFPAMPCC